MDEIFNRLLREKLTPNSFYVLHCVATKTRPDAYVNASLEITRLKQQGWLKNDLQITDKSIIFMQEINGFFKRSKKSTSKTLMGDDFLNNIETYNQIFPNKKLSSGKYARSNVKNLENAFRWFFDVYDYSWDTILKATKRYVNEYRMAEYDFMRTSQYFIRKQSSDKTFDSDLATYCEVVLNKPVEENTGFNQRIV